MKGSIYPAISVSLNSFPSLIIKVRVPPGISSYYFYLFSNLYAAPILFNNVNVLSHLLLGELLSSVSFKLLFSNDITAFSSSSSF